MTVEYGHETNHACEHGKLGGQYCAACNPPNPRLMAMERACARNWFETHPSGLESAAEFEQAIEDLAEQFFHYLNGWQEEG
jgi:hypothetical protein